MTWYKPWTWARKTISVDSALLTPSYSDIGWSADSYWHLSREAMEQCSTVYRCINLTAKTGATVPLGSFEGDEAVDGQFEIMDRLKRPNKIMSYSSFIRYWIMSMQLGGQAFIWNNRSSINGEGLELWPIPPTDMTANLGARFGEIDSFTWSYKGNSIRLPPEDVLYTWYQHPRDFMEPLSPLKAAAREVDLSNESLAWNVSTMNSGGKPSVSVAPAKGDTDSFLTQAQAKELEEGIIKRIGGSANAGKPLVMRWPMDLNVYGWSPSDMDWLSGLDKMDVRIANVFDIPPELVGAQKTYENFEVAERVLYTQAVIPLMELFADSLTMWPGANLRGSQEIRVLRSQIDALKDDQAVLSTMLNDSIRHGRMTPNEARAEMGMDTSTDANADILLIDKNLIPLSLAGMDGFAEDLE